MQNRASLCLQVGILVVAAAILGVGIATLITVLNYNDYVEPVTPDYDYTTPTGSTTDLPPPQPNPYGIPTADVVDTKDAHYSTYNSYSKLLSQWMDPSKDPCNDFYGFVCGKQAGEMSFEVSDEQNTAALLKILKDDKYFANASLPMQQMKWFFDTCVQENSTQTNDEVVAQSVKQWNAFRKQSNIKVPAMYPKDKVTKITPRQLALILGSAWQTFHQTSLIDVGVDTDWKNPHDASEGYVLLVDQPAPMFSDNFYEKLFDKPIVQRRILARNMVAFLNAISYFETGMNTNITEAYVEACTMFDYTLATEYDSDQYTRRNMERSYNPMTVAEMQARWTFIDWQTYFSMVLDSVSVNVNATTRVVVMEVEKMDKLNKDFSSMDPDTVSNYVALVALKSLSFPPHEPTKLSEEDRKFLVGVERRPRSNKRIRSVPRMEETLGASPSESQCASLTQSYMDAANSRAFVDAVYPTPQARKAIRDQVSEIVRSVLVGFRYQVDILDWMSHFTKTGAYSKIDNLVVNIAYPDWVMDDGKLTAYYEGLDVSKDDSLLTMKTNLEQFSLDKMLGNLAGGTVDRTDWGGPAAITNAWYQPQLNSITFPGGILHAPFFDKNYPASVNYGAMGIIAGHELTHGFDDEGVEWDATGVLSRWMDTNSSKHFDEMADCIVKEYDKFCPADLKVCNDGRQTQGENIADNGGIHSAYNAFKAYEAFYGQEPRLPGHWSYLTPDQLFFISFANVWCQQPAGPISELISIMVDPHSASQYRVEGTIKNFPKFQEAFNCPKGSEYAPEKHCDVYTSKTTPGNPVVQGVPQVPENDVHVLPAVKVNPSNLAQYNMYTKTQAIFQSTMDFSFEPCQDFYNYTCQAYPGEQNTFYDMDASNTIIIRDKLTSSEYKDTIKNSTALTKLNSLYKACIDEYKNPTISTVDYVGPYMQQLADALQQEPCFFADVTVAKNVDQKKFGAALSFMSYTLGIDTFLTPLVDTYWPNPQGANTSMPSGNFRHVAPLTAFYSRPYYEDDAAWEHTLITYKPLVENVVRAYAKQQKRELAANFTEQIDVYLEYERELVVNWTQTDAQSRQFRHQWNVKDTSNATGEMPLGVDWPAYFAAAPLPEGYDPAENTDVNFQEFDMMHGMLRAMEPMPSDRELTNYMFIRLLLARANLIPCSNGDKKCMNTMSMLGRKPVRSTHGRQRNPHIVARIPSLQSAASDDDVSQMCADATSAMADAQGRIYIDALYPTADDRDAIRKAVDGVASNIINAMKGMLESLDWMSDDSKTKAVAKANGIVRNIAFPDFIMDDAQLDASYADLNLTAMNFYQMLDAITLHNLAKQYKLLLDTKANRNDFLGQTAVVNAWYQPELNSITFPAGILQTPYFDVNNPVGLNYGGLGVVAGHELTHGFDDEGVQWDADGTLYTWMDEYSQTGFNAMARCVIEEYDKFCPLDESYVPNCTSGERTQGENIADNGGIHAAWRAMLSHIELDGASPLFSDPIMGEFTHEQLFFLGFTEVWCMSPGELTQDFMYKRLMIDPHSLGPYRVQGTLQNIPAFAAHFNCPAGTKYNPATHCNVWVPTRMP